MASAQTQPCEREKNDGRKEVWKQLNIIGNIFLELPHRREENFSNVERSRPLGMQNHRFLMKFNPFISEWDLFVNYVAELCTLFVGQSPTN